MPTSRRAKCYFGSVAYRKGANFTRQVSEVVEKVFPDIRTEVKMSELGAALQPDLGDVDVLAWRKESGTILLIECKRLKTALTVGQVVQQLEDFRGDIEKKDYLGKHKRRVEWLKENSEAISRMSSIPKAKIRWVSLVVTSGRVPMSYLDGIDFPKEGFIPYQELEAEIQIIRARA